MFVTCVNELHVDSDGDPSDICSVENEGYFGADEAWANTRLLAAAPSMADALSGLDNFAWSAVTTDCDESRLYLMQLIEAARAAIAKARGEK